MMWMSHLGMGTSAVSFSAPWPVVDLWVSYHILQIEATVEDGEMHESALFTIDRQYKQPMCPTVDE